MADETGESVSLLKPDPFMLDSIAALPGCEATHRYYVGDLPDDMVAAARAESGYTGIGFAHSADDGVQTGLELRRTGAAHVIREFSELLEIVS